MCKPGRAASQPKGEISTGRIQALSEAMKRARGKNPRGAPHEGNYAGPPERDKQQRGNLNVRADARDVRRPDKVGTGSGGAAT